MLKCSCIDCKAMVSMCIGGGSFGVASWITFWIIFTWQLQSAYQCWKNSVVDLHSEIYVARFWESPGHRCLGGALGWWRYDHTRPATKQWRIDGHTAYVWQSHGIWDSGEAALSQQADTPWHDVNTDDKHSWQPGHDRAYSEVKGSSASSTLAIQEWLARRLVRLTTSSCSAPLALEFTNFLCHRQTFSRSWPRLALLEQVVDANFLNGVSHVSMEIPKSQQVSEWQAHLTTSQQADLNNNLFLHSIQSGCWIWAWSNRSDALHLSIRTEDQCTLACRKFLDNPQAACSSQNSLLCIFHYGSRSWCGRVSCTGTPQPRW